MPDGPITGRPVLAVADLADIIHVVDVSDLTDSPQGTSKQATLQTLETLFGGDFVLKAGDTMDLNADLIFQNGDITGLDLLSANYGVFGIGHTVVALNENLTVGNSNTNSSSNTICNGNGNSIDNLSDNASILGGASHSIINSDNSTISGGALNTIDTSSESSIAGGQSNTIESNSRFSFIFGGIGGSITDVAISSAILNGNNCVVEGSVAMAGGNQAEALHDGSIVLGDSQLVVTQSSDDDQFIVRAGGGSILSNMTTAGRTSLTHRQGLTVYDTDFDAWFTSDGTDWIPVNSTSEVAAISAVQGTSTRQLIMGNGAREFIQVRSSGLIWALGLNLGSPRTAGTCEFRVTVNGVAQTAAGQTVTIDAVNTQFVWAILSSPISVVAGNLIGYETNTIGFTPTNASATAIIHITS